MHKSRSAGWKRISSPPSLRFWIFAMHPANLSGLARCAQDGPRLLVTKVLIGNQ
jgi:hypothetical protein